MNIGEMELRTGLERANIRFYEKEGFLTPTRRENGYRDYSQADLDTLLRIKLLRRRGLRLEEIKAIQSGEQELEAALQRRLAAIGAQRRELDAAEQVCSRMRQDGARYATLDAALYLRAFDAAMNLPAATAVPASDREEPVRTPWRRFFARGLDLMLVAMVWRLGLAVFSRVNLADLTALEEWLLDLATWGLLVPLEALMLSRWGTTPGKWLMGLRLEHPDGRLLTFGEGAVWTMKVFARGEGFVLPFYSLYRNWRCYKDVMEEGGTEWDYDTVILAAPFHWSRAVAYGGIRALSMVLAFFCMMIPARPIHRGENLTVEQFVENYNAAARFYGMDDTLRTDGTDGSQQKGTGGIVIPVVDATLVEQPLSLIFTEENGFLTGISYVNGDTSSIWGSTPDALGKNAMQMCVWAFAGADDGLFARYSAMQRLDPVVKMGVGNTVMEILGCELRYTIEDTGKTLPENSAFWERNRQAVFSLTKK